MMCVPLHSFLQHASRPNSTLSNSLKSTRVRVFTPLKLENATNQMLFLFLSNHHVIENWVSRMRERESGRTAPRKARCVTAGVIKRGHCLGVRVEGLL